MTNVMVMAAFDAVNEQSTRVAWRHVAFAKMKDMPKSENKAVGVSQTPAKTQSLQEQYAEAMRITKMLERRR